MPTIGITVYDANHIVSNIDNPIAFKLTIHLLSSYVDNLNRLSDAVIEGLQHRL